MRPPRFPWLFFTSLLLAFRLVSVSGYCLGDQKDLLLQLKGSLEFDRSVPTKLETWNRGSDCSAWRGVTWDASGHVAGLDLSGESIAGGLENSALFGLQYLRELNLASNSFNYVEIPAGLDKLPRLSHLNLSNAVFAGQIPIQISRMTALVSLDLSNEYYPDTLPLKLEKPNLEMFVHDLNSLKELRLDGADLSAQGHGWCRALLPLQNLHVLSLSNCKLAGPVDASLALLQSLSVVSLAQNSLSGSALNIFAGFPNLISLQLSSCGLSGRFPPRVLQVPTLQTLVLEENEHLQGSLPAFSPNASLQILRLGSCSFSGAIPASMSKLSQLVYLDFSFNRFSGAIPGLHLSTNLEYMDFSSNNFTGPITSTGWEALRKLSDINLQDNSLEGSIPPALFTLPSLRSVQLSGNRFNGQLRLENLTASPLESLDLSGNKLNGSIPMPVFKLGRLRILRLFSNEFCGRITLDSILELVNLTNLNLSHNKLSIDASPGKSLSPSSSHPQLYTLRLASCRLRVFPNLRNQARLGILDLSGNDINGMIPNWIWKTESLGYLNLSNNLFRGLQEPYTIPSTLGVLDLHDNLIDGRVPTIPPGATYVDYSINRLNLSIPANIGNDLSYAVFFSLSSNSLTGPIPRSICNAPSLMVLDLSDNALDGTIPPCLIEGSGKLQVLNLSGNKLQRFGAEKFHGECGLVTLDLNANHLQGHLLRSVVKCMKLELLNLGNNNITDAFPCWLRHASNLRVLILRSNSFYGSINCSGESNRFPNLQIIDLASNNFSGVLSPESFNSWNSMIRGEDEELNHLHVEFLEVSKANYQDQITVTSKGMVIELVKILTVFTSIDLSNNSFRGNIPEAVGNLTSLYFLNLSHNALTGTIPTSIGNLGQLESLDLSHNHLSGNIPLQVENLTFLSFLNLAYNQLIGSIPKGAQMSTFSAASYMGNRGLCGPPLSVQCEHRDEIQPPLIPASEEPVSVPVHKSDGQFILSGLGFGMGAGVILMPLVFWKRGREWYDRKTKKWISMISPSMMLFYARYENGSVVPMESNEARLMGITGDFDIDYGDEEDEDEDDTFHGRFCVFCSKLDIQRRKVVHNLECRCYESPLPSPFSSSSTSSLQPSSSIFFLNVELFACT